MEKCRRFFKEFYQNKWWLPGGLILLSIAVIIASCGKLSDDSDRPYTPTGSSGGQTIPIALPDAVGSYSLTLTAADDKVPADGVTYTILQAKVHDSAGGRLENFLITFDTSPESDAIGLFLNPATTAADSSPATTTSGRTSVGGGVSVRLYGVLSGSCVAQASVDIDGDGANDLYKTVVVVFTPAGSPNTAGGYSLELSADPDEIPGDAGTASVITAQLVDASGGSVQDFTILLEDMTKFGGFEGGGTTGTAGSTTYEGTTDVDGKVSVRYYGETPGVALIRASVTVNDLVGELVNTVKVTIYEVVIPDPVIVLESEGNATVSQSRIYDSTTGTYQYTWSTASLDAILRVEDGNGDRVGGVTLAYSIINKTGCGGVAFSEIFETTTTNIAGRALVDTEVSGTGGTSPPDHCQYDLEIIYNDVIYVLSPGGQVKACLWDNSNCP